MGPNHYTRMDFCPSSSANRSHGSFLESCSAKERRFSASKRKCALALRTMNDRLSREWKTVCSKTVLGHAVSLIPADPSECHCQANDTNKCRQETCLKDKKADDCRGHDCLPRSPSCHQRPDVKPVPRQSRRVVLRNSVGDLSCNALGFVFAYLMSSPFAGRFF